MKQSRHQPPRSLASDHPHFNFSLISIHSSTTFNSPPAPNSTESILVEVKNDALLSKLMDRDITPWYLTSYVSQLSMSLPTSCTPQLCLHLPGCTCFPPPSSI